LGASHPIPKYAICSGSASPALTGLELAQTDKKWPDDIVKIATDQSLTPFDRLIELLASTQEEFQENMLKYFTSCSRRNMDSGLLAGSPMRREDNYYTLGIKLLETLVQLLVLKPNDPPKSHPLDIYEFVRRLKERYGIWIDEPPPGLEQSYESRQAAQANFFGLEGKLRQLGFFRSVTDAMRMQRLRPRYAPVGDIETKEGVIKMISWLELLANYFVKLYSDTPAGHAARLNGLNLDNAREFCRIVRSRIDIRWDIMVVTNQPQTEWDVALMSPSNDVTTRTGVVYLSFLEIS
jgi:hypothetical protein